MAKFKLVASIGFPGANQEDEYEIDDELNEAAANLGNEHLETWWKIFTTGDNSGYDKTVSEADVKKTVEIMKSKGYNLDSDERWNEE